MAELPFLVVHGAVVAKLCVGAVTAAAFALTLWLRARSERKRTRALAARYVARAEVPAAGRATLRGKLAGEAATLASSEGGPEVPRSHRSAELVLDVAGDRVELRGAVRVLRGATAATGWRKPPRGTPPELAKGVAPGRRVLYRVQTGDDVVVAGVLASRANRDEGGYRDAAGGWVLEPLADSGVIEIVASTPASRPAALGLIMGLTLLGMYGVMTYAALREAGSWANERARKQFDVDGHSLTELGAAVQIAAALPHSREEALEAVERLVEYEFPRGAQTDELFVEIGELRRGCAGKARALLRTERFEEAAETARTCGDDRTTLDALAYLGRYDEGLAIAQRANEHDRTTADRLATFAIASGKWAIAASALDDVATAWRSQLGHGDSDERLIVRVRMRRAQCLAEWSRLLAGDKSATARIQQLVETNDSTTCRIVLALQQTGRARLDQLANAEHEVRFDDATTVARDLSWVFGEGDTVRDLYPLIAALGHTEGVDNRGYLAKWALEERAPDAKDRDSVLAESARLYLAHGDRERALAALAEASAMVPADRAPYTKLRFDNARMAIELHGPSTSLDPAPGHEPDALAYLRMGKVVDDLEPYSHACKTGLRSALESAVTGDGGPLATLLATCNVYWLSADVILAVLPRVTQHREELAAALRVFRDDLGLLVEDAPLRAVPYALTHRDLARLAGDEPSAARWQQILDRQLAVLADRDRLIAFLLLRS